MPKQDQLERGIIKSMDIRFVFADCPQTAQTVILKHNCDPVSAHLLARAVGAAALLSALLTEDEKYTIRWNYKGQLKCLLADCDARAQIRAFIQPTDLAAHVQSEADIYGNEGAITLVKSSETKVLNSGSTEAGLLDVADDLAFFLSTSDQIETALTVIPTFNPDPENPVRTLKAVMLQALPDCDLIRFDRIRARLASPAVRKLLLDDVTQDNIFERIVMELTRDEDAGNTFSSEHAAAPSFYCNCSKKRMIDVLATLSKDDLDAAFAPDGTLSMTCKFCNSIHKISREDLD